MSETADIHIEVYEWKEGKPRPGSEAKLRHFWIDNLEIPTNGQVLQRGDVLTLWSATTQPTRYVVLEREPMWFRTSRDDGEAPAPWMKMSILVWRVADYSELAQG